VRIFGLRLKKSRPSNDIAGMRAPAAFLLTPLAASFPLKRATQTTCQPAEPHCVKKFARQTAVRRRGVVGAQNFLLGV